MEDQFTIRNTRTGQVLTVLWSKPGAVATISMNGWICPTRFNRTDAEWWSAAWLHLTGDHDIEITPA